MAKDLVECYTCMYRYFNPTENPCFECCGTGCNYEFNESYEKMVDDSIALREEEDYD